MHEENLIENGEFTLYVQQIVQQIVISKQRWIISSIYYNLDVYPQIRTCLP